MWNSWAVGIWPVFGFLWFLLILFLIFAAVRWMVGGRRGGGYGCGRGSRGWHSGAEDIVRERLARGEIDDKEYERLLGILRR